MDKLKKIISVILTILVISLGSYYISQHFKPCRKPITYSIGSFDSRFGISKDHFVSDVNQAEKIWEKPIDREMFTYSVSGKLKINLIYDYRQEAVQKLQKIGLNIQNTQSSYYVLKDKYGSLIKSYDQKKSEIDSLYSSYLERKSNYELEVKYWNTHRGLTKENYDRLEKEKNAVNSLASDLQEKQQESNSIVEDANSLASVLNRMAAELNLQTEKYNKIGTSVEKEFEEGIYKKDWAGSQIDIYEFDNEKQLIRVLAHELGHALGLVHVDNPQAIMYKLNQSTNDKLTDDDLTELKSLCRLK